MATSEFKIKRCKVITAARISRLPK